MEPNDGGSNKYEITYDYYIDEKGETRYLYSIKIKYPGAQEFKLDDFKMLKDLMKAHFGNDYDLANTDSWIQGHIDDVNQRKTGTGDYSRTKGDYEESIYGGAKSSQMDGLNIFKYSIRLK